MDLREQIGLGSLAFFVRGWLGGDYDDSGCCLGCVIVVVAALLGVGLLVYLLW